MRRDLHVVWWSGGPVWARSRLGRPTVFQSSVEGHRGQGTFAGSRFPTPRRCAPLMSGIGPPIAGLLPFCSRLYSYRAAPPPTPPRP